jgi:hypothetical protein
MTINLRSGPALGVIVALFASLSATSNSGRLDETWPNLLSQETAGDPVLAQLHRRANAALEKLVQSEDSPQWTLHLADSRSDDGVIITEH